MGAPRACVMALICEPRTQQDERATVDIVCLLLFCPGARFRTLGQIPWPGPSGTPKREKVSISIPTGLGL